MADNARGDSVFTKKLTCSASSQEENLLGTKHFVCLIADADCFVNFDKDVTATGRLLIKADEVYELHLSGGVSQLNYMADSGTPALYVIANKSWRA